MGVSVRSFLMAGVAAFSAAALVLPTSVSPPVHERPSPAVALSAHVGPLPKPIEPTVLTSGEGADARPIAILTTSGDSQRIQLLPVPMPVAADPGDVTTFNAASDIINSVYSFTRYWANYAALQLAPWALGWIPFGWIIGDQITIVYSNLVLPITDSFVYDFLDPVVNNPLNLATWVDGGIAIANATINGLIDTGIAEVYWAWSLLPLPPLPPLPGILSTSDELQRTMVADSELVGFEDGAKADGEIITDGVIDDADPIVETGIDTDLVDTDLVDVVDDDVDVVDDDGVTDEDTDIDETDLEETDLGDTDLEDVDLEDADLEDTDLEDVDLEDADLEDETDLNETVDETVDETDTTDTTTTTTERETTTTDTTHDSVDPK